VARGVPRNWSAGGALLLLGGTAVMLGHFGEMLVKPRHLLVLVLALVTTVARAAAAQTTNTTVTVHPSSPAPVQATTTVKHRAPPTLFPHSRLPVRLNAPVLPPYDNSSFHTYGGQPETGADATMAQGSVNPH